MLDNFEIKKIYIMLIIYLFNERTHQRLDKLYHQNDPGEYGHTNPLFASITALIFFKISAYVHQKILVKFNCSFKYFIVIIMIKEIFFRFIQLIVKTTQHYCVVETKNFTILKLMFISDCRNQ